MVSGKPDPTRPAKSEMYHLINDAIIKKWQIQRAYDNNGHMLHFGQHMVKTQSETYSTNRHLNTV